MSPEAASPPPSPPPSVPPSSLPPPPQAASERAKTALAATIDKRLEDRTKVSFRRDRHDAKVLLQAIGSVLPCQRKGSGGAQSLSITYQRGSFPQAGNKASELNRRLLIVEVIHPELAS